MGLKPEPEHIAPLAKVLADQPMTALLVRCVCVCVCVCVEWLAYACSVPPPSLTHPTPQDRFVSMCKLDGSYFLCTTRSMHQLAKLLQPLRMKLLDRFTFCMAPVNASQLETKAYIMQVPARRPHGACTPIAHSHQHHHHHHVPGTVRDPVCGRPSCVLQRPDTAGATHTRTRPAGNRAAQPSSGCLPVARPEVPDTVH